MARNFSAEVADWVKRSEDRLMAVVKEAAQETFNEARLPKGQGGRLPVDTGYLRNSAVAGIGSMPSGDSGGDMQITLTIARMRPGETLYLGFGANYAIYMEAQNAFVEMAAQNWQRNVDRVVRRVAR